MLAGAVASPGQHRRANAGDGGDGDHDSVVALAHDFQNRLHDVKHAIEIDSDDAIEIFAAQLPEFAVRHVRPGVVHEDVDLSELAERPVGHSADRRSVGHVQCVGMQSPAAPARSISRTLQLSDRATDGDDLRSLVSERSCDSLANAAPGSGDDRNLSLQAHTDPFPPRSGDNRI